MAQIEKRFADAGFVYTGHTRMLFARKFTSTRREEDRSSPDLVMMAAGRWPEPTDLDVQHVRAALIEEYPDRCLYAETDEGLVPIYEPAKPSPVELASAPAPVAV